MINSETSSKLEKGTAEIGNFERLKELAPRSIQQNETLLHELARYNIPISLETEKCTTVADFIELIYNPFQYNEEFRENIKNENIVGYVKNLPDNINKPSTIGSNEIARYNQRYSFEGGLIRFRKAEKSARENMVKRAAELDSQKEKGITLISVASQHPLEVDESGKRCIPGKEFRERLDIAIEELKKKGGKIVLFGGIHRNDYPTGDKQLDDVSLAEAGRNYLLSKSVDTSFILCNESTTDVYSSGDEQFQVAQVFKQNPEFNKIIAIGSPAQTLRMMVHSLFCGVIPEVRSTQEEGNSHGLDNELFITQDVMRQPDPTFQNPELCSFAWINRIQRMPFPDLAEYIESNSNLIAKITSQDPTSFHIAIKGALEKAGYFSDGIEQRISDEWSGDEKEKDKFIHLIFNILNNISI